MCPNPLIFSKAEIKAKIGFQQIQVHVTNIENTKE